jgi:hypothetical protein
MSKVPYSLIGFEGYAEEDAKHMHELFSRVAPLKPKSATVLALETETANLPNYPVTIIKLTHPKPLTLNTETKLVEETIPKISPDDYPQPWCKVYKDNKLIRYEDANGKIIPEILWSKPKN